MNNEFYDKIVYKKNAFVELKEDLQQNYYGKNILIVTTKSLVGNHLTEILNSVSLARCSFKHFVSKNNFCLSDVQNLATFIEKEHFDLLISFGGAKTCNVVKFFSSVFNIPFYVCPSACSSFAYFNNICINPYDTTKSFVCNFAEKFYISESVIKTCPMFLVKQGIYMILSMQEMLSCNIIENILFDNHIDLKNIAKIVENLKTEISQTMSGDSEEKLKLMDKLIDLSYILKDVNLFKNATFNLYCVMNKVFEQTQDVVCSGEVYYISSKVLLLSYIQLFSQKNIRQIDFPNFKKVATNINKYSIFCKQLRGVNFCKNLLLKRELLTRVNNLKEEFCFQCKKRLLVQDEVINTVKLYDNVFTYNIPKINDVFVSLSVLPYICENNYIVSLLGATGYINAF